MCSIKIWLHFLYVFSNLDTWMTRSPMSMPTIQIIFSSNQSMSFFSQPYTKKLTTQLVRWFHVQKRCTEMFEKEHGYCPKEKWCNILWTDKRLFFWALKQWNLDIVQSEAWWQKAQYIHACLNFIFYFFCVVHSSLIEGRCITIVTVICHSYIVVYNLSL